jgi:DNA-binding NarL/FixJ family response regulator
MRARVPEDAHHIGNGTKRRDGHGVAVPTSARSTRVVTVDDQALFLDAARAIVAGVPGFELAGETTDGAAALGLVRDVDPDIVLVDVRMNGLDGIEVAERLRQEDPTRVVVLVSSADPRELTGLARSCGAAALLRKQWLTPRLLRGLWIAHRRR